MPTGPWLPSSHCLCPLPACPAVPGPCLHRLSRPGGAGQGRSDRNVQVRQGPARGLGDTCRLPAKPTRASVGALGKRHSRLLQHLGAWAVGTNANLSQDQESRVGSPAPERPLDVSPQAAPLLGPALPHQPQPAPVSDRIGPCSRVVRQRLGNHSWPPPSLLQPVFLGHIPLPHSHGHTLCTAPPAPQGLRDSGRCLLPGACSPACPGPRNSCQLRLKLPTRGPST